MKKSILFLLAALLVCMPLVSASAEATLVIGTWRPDDTPQWERIIAAYKEVAPDVTLEYAGITSKDYNATLRTQLDAGKGPDLIMARSYATGIDLYNVGYLGNCDDIPGMENFAASALEPWQTPEGASFAVPTAAVSHGVYYNKDIFAANGIEVPATYEDFIALCQKLLDAGITPLGNGVADEWDILECFFLGMLPNYVGGADERVKYENGEKLLNDEAFVAAYADFQKIAPFLPEGFTAVGNTDSNTLFALGKTAMYVDGSWSSGTLGDVEFEWGVFAIPAPAGKDTRICFHPDFAMTFNPASEYIEEAKAFLAWTASPEGAQIVANQLPVGFYPMINLPITLDDPHGNEFLALNQGKELDARFVWPKLMDLYKPMNDELIKLLKAETTPQEAADAVAALFPAA